MKSSMDVAWNAAFEKGNDPKSIDSIPTQGQRSCAHFARDSFTCLPRGAPDPCTVHRFMINPTQVELLLKSSLIVLS
jgi:hypothetical protein